MADNFCSSDTHCYYQNAAKNTFEFFCVGRKCVAPKKAGDFCSQYSACPSNLVCKNGRCSDGKFNCGSLEYYDSEENACKIRVPIGSACPASMDGSEEPCLGGVCHLSKCHASCLFDNPRHRCVIPFTKCSVIQPLKEDRDVADAKNDYGACIPDTDARFGFRIGGGGGSGGSLLRRYNPREKPIKLTTEIPPEEVIAPDRGSYERTKMQGIIFMSVGGFLFLLLAAFIAALKFSQKKKKKKLARFVGPNDVAASSGKDDTDKAFDDSKQDESAEMDAHKPSHLGSDLQRQRSMVDRSKET